MTVSCPTCRKKQRSRRGIRPRRRCVKCGRRVWSWVLHEAVDVLLRGMIFEAAIAERSA